MARKRKPQSPKEVTHLSHDETRKNIPTEELRDFVAEDEQQPRTMLYPRDPSLDPQLVWQGKDEEDLDPLAVPVPPIYIQEKIQPQAIIEDLRAHQGDAPQQLDLFDDFNGIEFEELIEFYQHEQRWSNRLILGDSLQVMVSLAEKEGLKGRVQMIYIDPPYGIKFGSNWQVRIDRRQVEDGKVEDVVRQPEQIKAFRDTWEKGVHSYLSYLRDRFVVARELLNENGSIFVQISNENVHLVRSVMDEVFGSENHISTLVWKKGSPQAKHIMNAFNYILWYAKDESLCKSKKIFRERAINEGSTEDPRKLALRCESPDGISRALTSEEKRAPWLLPEGVRVYRVDKISGSNGPFEFYFEGETYLRQWKGDEIQMERLKKSGRITKTPKGLGYKFYLPDDSPVIEITNWWEDTAGKIPDMLYVVQTNSKIIERCLLMSTDPGDIVLDPTCGSGTTAYVAELWGRRWITIDTSRVAVTLARARLMGAKFPYYLLADSPEGFKKQKELGRIPPDAIPPSFGLDVRRSFVYHSVPHIKLKDVANNEEIDAIHARYQPELDQLRAEINALTGQHWEEWEIPRLPSPYQTEKERQATEKALADQGITPDSDAWKKLEAWWSLRRQRQQEIDDSIARNAGQEILYDQPYEDKKRIRVTGPFTVESLSPYRIISPDMERPASERAAEEENAEIFIETILANLRRAGVQNTKKGERLKFDMLEPFAGTWIQAEGEYTTKDGEIKRVAVAIGPEFGTVGPQLVKEAAKEAVRGVGFDLLLVCGFAFDPHVSEEAKRYGRLEVLPVRMNPDLAMGEALLKKTGSGNLFMIFGEPDIEVRDVGDDQIEVEIRGLDIYDPTTGEIRASSVDDIACWFIDTDYNEESFFVRHAYFSGMKSPYKQLQRVLKAEINEEAWQSLYRTVSRPFPKPSTGKIAIKVINHYGDEVLKVYDIT